MLDLKVRRIACSPVRYPCLAGRWVDEWVGGARWVNRGMAVDCLSPQLLHVRHTPLRLSHKQLDESILESDFGVLTPNLFLISLILLDWIARPNLHGALDPAVIAIPAARMSFGGVIYAEWP